jgi:hypothetical protein
MGTRSEGGKMQCKRRREKMIYVKKEEYKDKK